MKIEGEKPLFYGSRCEKYEVGKSRSSTICRTCSWSGKNWLYGEEPPKEGKRAPSVSPEPCSSRNSCPSSVAFFEDLGFTVVYSPKTNKKVINQGTEAMAAEPSYPVKVAHGHILALLKAGVKRIFLAQPHRPAPTRTPRSAAAWSVPWPNP